MDTSLRRSQRVLLQSLINSPPLLTQEQASEKSINGVLSVRRSPRFSTQKCEEEFHLSRKRRNNGSSTQSSKKAKDSINGVEGILGFRRSPRVSCKKGSDFTDKEPSSSSTQGRRKKKKEKKQVICEVEEERGNTHFSEKSINGVEEFLGLRRSPWFDKQEVQTRGKKDFEHDEDLSMPLGKPVIGKIEDRGNTHLRAPLRSIGNVSTKTDGAKGLRKNVVTQKKNLNSVKKKSRNTQNNQFGGLPEWTKVQESALQRAFLAAKPSPHFWKKVSKLVPGRSAQECFDKIHSDCITPPQPQPRSRAKSTNLSPLGHLSLSGSKLLKTAERNTKRPRTNKQKKCLAHKTVRHLLQKHTQVDQGYQADLFSVLEPTVNSSPTQTKLLCGALKENENVSSPHERSTSTHIKPPPLSRFSGQTTLVSPPVLKPIKNKVLHEKYIDQLHYRDARRVTAGKGKGKEGKSDDNVQKVDVVNVARNALVSDARDVINHFQHLRANLMNVYEDDAGTSGEDEGEDEP